MFRYKHFVGDKVEFILKFVLKSSVWLRQGDSDEFRCGLTDSVDLFWQPLKGRVLVSSDDGSHDITDALRDWMAVHGILTSLVRPTDLRSEAEEDASFT